MLCPSRWGTLSQTHHMFCWCRFDTYLQVCIRSRFDPYSQTTHHVFCWCLLDPYSQVCSRSRFDSYSQTTHTFRWGTLSRVDGDLVLSRWGSPPCPRVDGELCPSKGFTTCFVLGIGADGSVFWIMAAASLCLKTLKTHKSIFGL